LLKARAVAAATGLPALADDSGLEVEALDGAPGVRSARWAPTDGARLAKLLDALRDVPPPRRGARFRCVVVLAWPDGRSEAAEGTCAGQVALSPAGSTGFGYDPVFVADELGCTLAEAGPEAKQRVSHRARACDPGTLRAARGRVREGRLAGRGVAQPGSAPALGAGGRPFKSARPDHSAPVAQWTERRPSKPWVRGSNPFWRASKRPGRGRKVE